MSSRYRVVDLAKIEGVPCPCGTAKRAFTDDDDQIASIHEVEIKVDSKTHYHKKHAEIYYILEGEGILELDGDEIPVGPGTAVLIKPECRHRAVGTMRLLNIPVPAFDPEDEWFD